MPAGAVLDNKTAQIIDGKLIADTIRKELALEVAALKSKHGRVPGLAVVLVGSRGDSATYVRMKSKACVEVGIESFSTNLPEDISEEDLLKVNMLPATGSILICERWILTGPSGQRMA